MDSIDYINERYTAPDIFSALEGAEARLIKNFPEHASFIRQRSDETFHAIERLMDVRPERMRSEEAILPRQLVLACFMRICSQVRQVRIHALEVRSARFPSIN